MKATPLLIAAAVVSGILLTGCAPQGHTSPATMPATTTATATGPVDDATVIPVPEASDTSRQTGMAAATQVMQTFAQPGLDAAAWMTQMTPLLSPTGYDAYQGTDPAQIPAHQATGPGIVLPGSTDVALIVQIPTDAGLYNIALSRKMATLPWLADQIRPAQS